MRLAACGAVPFRHLGFIRIGLRPVWRGSDDDNDGSRTDRAKTSSCTPRAAT